MAMFHRFLLLTLAVSMVSGEECKSPPTTFGTTHDGGDTLVFTTGQTIQYTCDFGHFAVGSTTRICQEGGVWTENDDICRLDVASLSLACIGGITAVFIFFALSCWMVTRRSRAKRRAERRLTIQREKNKQNVNGGLNGPAAVPEGAYNTRKSQITERSDSGLQTDLDLEDTNLNEFDVTIDSPTDNQSAYTSDFQMSVDDEIEG
ncbi:uncharacterized protein LOC117304605 isoform X2 [Asterias rubens]|uniref:uncharacterized protein LOC117304605 isoform X2 n=1 Tax=Asterias rubens TaxID=7604 RepID=UPI001455C837|nr:uncharacterized protein LOC117304605 isoform X2 [Asterias rubens]